MTGCCPKKHKDFHDSIVKYIEDNPGVRGRPLADHFEQEPPTLQRHLRVLQTQGRIRREGITSGARWFPGDGTPPQPAIKLKPAAPFTPTPRQAPRTPAPRPARASTPIERHIAAQLENRTSISFGDLILTIPRHMRQDADGALWTIARDVLQQQGWVRTGTAHRGPTGDIWAAAQGETL